MAFDADSSSTPEVLTGRISPTDISQYIRLDQCQRYLALRLMERKEGRNFVNQAGFTPQSIPPLLTRSGTQFENKIEKAIGNRFVTVKIGEEDSPTNSFHNQRVIDISKSLPAGESLCLFQVRLQVRLNGWDIRGDIDILKLEKDAEGTLSLLVADIKSSTSAKMEHRLQVAFYQTMLAELFDRNAMPYKKIETAILYRGESGPFPALSLEETRLLEEQRAEAVSRFGLGEEDALLEIIRDQEAYLDSVRDLVTGPESIAFKIANNRLEELPYHLTYKCDGCLFNEYCMKTSVETDDLSLIPHLTALDKEALHRQGIHHNKELAALKEIKPDFKLQTSTGKEKLVNQLSATWPVGPRIDELVHRARLYRKWKKDNIEALPFIPSKGHGSLPYSDVNHNPNLVRIFIDAQHDYLQNRVYMLGARVAACEQGQLSADRSKNIVAITDGPPDSQEKEERLFVTWVAQVLKEIVDLAVPDEDGQKRAPIHLIFYDKYDQRVLLDGLSRHLQTLFGATPLYDFVTQLASFDSPVVTFLNEEIRELKNYPMVCQSLQQVAAYLRFDWNFPEKYRALFKEKMFDFWAKLDLQTSLIEPGELEWYNNRARFSSQIPLEYIYAAWGELPIPKSKEKDLFAFYRRVTLSLVEGFQKRRLEALEHVTKDFRGNHLTEKTPFNLPDLSNFTQKAASLAGALDEFITIEHHTELAGWKSVHNLAPERRVLMGETLIANYYEADQEPETAERNRENERRRVLKEKYKMEFFASNPEANKLNLTKDQIKDSKLNQEGLRFRLRLTNAGVDADLDDILTLSTLKEGESVIVYNRWTFDERLPEVERTLNTPTPKQMLYGSRATILNIKREIDPRGKTTAAFAEVEMNSSRGGPWSKGFVFGSIDRPLIDSQLYTLDTNPNNFYGYWCAVITEGLKALEEKKIEGLNVLYERISYSALLQRVNWPEKAIAEQARFMSGLNALYNSGGFHNFESEKSAYIGSHGSDPVLLVQGPPGTGKSYSTGFALFARLQGALGANLPFRVIVSCKTHAATDVLILNVLKVQQILKEIHSSHKSIFNEYFNPLLLDIPLYRVFPKETPPEGVNQMFKEEKGKGQPSNYSLLIKEKHFIAAATPGAVYKLIKDISPKTDGLFNHHFCDCLVLDEASQMNIPEAAMAALPLKQDAQIIVVGDHRQMAPIVKHDWENEPRRTFKEYKSYQSLFNTLLELNPPPPIIRFSESFRLHKRMAEFLRKEIYYKDGINYHSVKTALLKSFEHKDGFLEAVLAPQYPIVVIVHDEAKSQTRNFFEQKLVGPILEALASSELYGLDPIEGLGVVVPHRAQRAELQKLFPVLTIKDAETGSIRVSAVDTVERFQGGERAAIIISATESDPDYLLASGEFLFDPTRLTVAISRAKHKIILVASRSVFTLFSPDEQAYANSQIWKNLLRHTCTAKLWEGQKEGHNVQVWGN